MALRRLPLVWLRGSAACGVLAVLLLAVWSSSGPNAALWRLLGIGGVPAASLPRTLSIVVTPAAPAFGPPAAALAIGGQVMFVNRLNTALIVRSTALASASFKLVVPAHSRASVTLNHAGLYHYYDAATAHPLPPVDKEEEYHGWTPFTDPSDVIATGRGKGLPRQGWIEVLDGVPGLQEHLIIPRGHSVFSPKVLTIVAGGTVIVVNRDTLPHNFVVDPFSPTGAAFMIDGAGNAAQAPQRALVLQQPGLYHVYCSLHTMPAGLIDGWHGVVPSMRGGMWADQDAMDAWIIVLPATVTA